MRNMNQMNLFIRHCYNHSRFSWLCLTCGILGKCKCGILCLLWCIFPVLGWAQSFMLKGTVGDEFGEPLIGVNVRVITPNNRVIGTVTDINGNYSILVEKAAKIEFSYVGFQTFQYVVKSNIGAYNVKLQMESEGLDEVVVVAYGSTRKATLTGAIGSVGSKELIKSPTATLANALSGKIPGLTSVQSSGAPGLDDPQILVRGIGTLTTEGSSPLILVDGVERSFTSIDPNEIADVSILKDASATAVFGVRGANGVILITTKRGEKGKTSVSLTSQVGVQLPTALLDFSNSYVRAAYMTEAEYNDGIAPEHYTFSKEIIEAFRDHTNPLIYPDIDWYDYVLKKAVPQTQHNLSISGGTDRARYFISLGYLYQQGLFETFGTDKNNNFLYNRYNFRSNVDIDITKSTLLSINLGGRVEKRNQPVVGEEQIFRFLGESSPTASPGVVDGKLIITNPEYLPKPGYNAFNEFYGRGYTKATKNVLNVDVTLNQKLDFITSGLSVKLKGAYNNDYIVNKKRTSGVPTYTPIILADGSIQLQKNGDEGKFDYSEDSNAGGRSSIARDWYMELGLNYSHTFGKHEVNALLLYNQSKKYYPSVYSEIAAGYVGLVGRVTYNYATRYLLDLNAGYNGSENFAPEQRFGFFPSLSVGWVLSNEKFFPQNDWLTYLKIRGSYGVVGNDKLGSNRFLYSPDTYGYSGGVYNFGTDNPEYVPGAYEGNIGNPNVTWEKAYKQNYGADLYLFKDRLKVNLDFFRERRKDILITRLSDPIITGKESPAINYGKVKNQGYEIALRWEDKIGKHFNYFISPSLSYSHNEIIEMDEVKPNEPYMSQTGHPVGQFFGYEFYGFYNGSETEKAYEQKYGKPFPDHGVSLQPGAVCYVDLNNDGIIDGDDIHPVGYTNFPEYSASLNLGFSYKGFDFSMVLSGVTNVSRKLSFMATPIGAQRTGGLLNENYTDRWTTSTASTATLPAPSFNMLVNNSKPSRLWIVDGDYIRLKNVELGYRLSEKTLKRLPFNSLRFYLNAYNLFTISDYPEADPEPINSARSYPLTRIINFGVSLNF